MSGLKSSREDRTDVPVFDVGDAAGYEDGATDPSGKHTEFAVGLSKSHTGNTRSRLREEQKTPVIPHLAARPKKSEIDALDAAPTPVIHPRLKGAPAPDGPLTSLAGVQPLKGPELYRKSEPDLDLGELDPESDVASQSRAVAASVDAAVDASAHLGQAQAHGVAGQNSRSVSLPLGAAPLDPSAFSDSKVARVEKLIDAVIDEVDAAEEANAADDEAPAMLVDDLIIDTPARPRRPGAGFSRAENQTQNIDGEAAAIDRAVFRSIVTGIRPPASAPPPATAPSSSLAPPSLSALPDHDFEASSDLSGAAVEVSEDMKVVLGQVEGKSGPTLDDSGLELAFEPKLRFTPRRPKASTARIEIVEPAIAPITRWVIYGGLAILALVSVYALLRG
ncbi:MAG: hypothetical protein AAF449_07185 [Myxococcota bacterium]